MIFTLGICPCWKLNFSYIALELYGCIDHSHIKGVLALWSVLNHWKYIAASTLGDVHNIRCRGFKKDSRTLVLLVHVLFGL